MIISVALIWKGMHHEHTPRLARRRAAGHRRQRPIEALVLHWMLRLLVPLKGYRHFVAADGYENTAIAQFLGLETAVDGDTPYSPSEALAALRRLQVQQEDLGRPPLPSTLQRNLEQLTVLLGLSEVDRRLLGFAIILHSHRLLDDAADYLGPQNSIDLYSTLANLLGLEEPEVRTALSNHSVMSRAGLLSVDRNGMMCLRGKLDLLSGEFAEQMLHQTVEDPAHLLRGTVNPSRPATLSLGDFAHVQKALAVLQPYLQRAMPSAAPASTFSSTANRAPARVNWRGSWPANRATNCMKWRARTTKETPSTANAACAPTAPPRTSSPTARFSITDCP